jgi:hypothetical protein
MKPSITPPQFAHLIQEEKDCSQQQVFPTCLPLAFSLFPATNYPQARGTDSFFSPFIPNLVKKKKLPFPNRNPACLLNHYSHHRLQQNFQKTPSTSSSEAVIVSCRDLAEYLNFIYHLSCKGKAPKGEKNDLK